jgi:hypothetical protein
MKTPRYDPSTFWSKILFGLAVFGLLCISLHAQTAPPVWFFVASEAQYQATSPIVELTAGATFTFGRLDGTLCDPMTATAVWIPVWVSSFASGTAQPCFIKGIAIPAGDPDPGNASTLYVLETSVAQFAQVKDPVDGTVTLVPIPALPASGGGGAGGGGTGSTVTPVTCSGSPTASVTASFKGFAFASPTVALPQANLVGTLNIGGLVLSCYRYDQNPDGSVGLECIVPQPTPVVSAAPAGR